MSLRKKISSSLSKFRRTSRAKLRKALRSTRFGFEKLEERQLLAADFIANEILVQFEPSMTEEMRAAVRPAGSTVVETIHTAMMQRVGEGVLERIQLSGSMTVADGIDYFGDKTGVRFAEPNYIMTAAAVSDDLFYTTGNLWGMYSDDRPGAVGPDDPIGITTNTFGSQAEKAWNQGAIGSNNVIVGVIDTGIQVTHPDLVDNIWVNPFDPVDGRDNDGNGYTDDTWGWDFAGNDRFVYDGLADDHGTHVAGTIGAKGGNQIGVAGVAWEASIISLKFLAPSGTTANAIRAIDYLTDLKVRHGLNIVASNNSWGGGAYSSSLHAAINRSAKRDILFIASAGNDNNNNDNQATYPASFSTLDIAGFELPATYEGVIAVANITSTGTRSSSSSYGVTSVDLGAPGEVIMSTLPGNTYGFASGTSMAAPHVTGAAVVYKARYPNAAAEEIRRNILKTAAPTASMTGLTVTGGRLDVNALIQVPPVPLISINDASVVEGDSGTRSMTFTVSLSRAFDQTISVNYATRSGSATSAIDFVSQSGTLTFAPGVTSRTITISVRGDLVVEPRELFYVDLRNPVNVEFKNNFGTGTIISDDFPEVTVEDISVVEGNSGVKSIYFTVALNNPHSQNVVVAYSTADGNAKTGSDYKGVSGTLTIPAGAGSGTIRIEVMGDSVVEENEWFTLNLSAAQQGFLIDNEAVAMILNDDSQQGVSIFDSGVVEGNTGRKNMYFTIALADVSNSFVTIHYATSNGTATVADKDYVAVSGQVSIRPGSSSATIAIPILGDRKIEADETFNVQIVRAFGAVIADGLAVGTIFNDDAGRAIPPPPGPTGFSSLAQAAASANSPASTNSNSNNSASGSGSNVVVLQPVNTVGTSRALKGPQTLPAQTMSQFLAMGSRIGPRTNESFANSVDLALVALLKDGERLAKLN